MNPAALNQELLAAAVASMPPGKLSAVRERAAASFAATGFPSVKEEDWKYTNLSAAAKLSNDWLQASIDGTRPAKPGLLSDTDLAGIVDCIDAHWLVITNGIVDATALNDFAAKIGPGVDVSRLADGVSHNELLVDVSMSAFNAALLRDGLHIRATGTVDQDKPIGLLFADDERDQVSQARVIIECDENAELSIIECAISAGVTQLSNLVCQVSLAAGAKLDYVRIQQRNHAHLGINRLTAGLGNDAVLNHSAFDFGNAMARNDVVIDITGAGAETNLHGLYLATDDQHIDNHLRVSHRTGPASSLQDYRGILNGRSRCVFNGKAEVLKGADGTDANQSNHNLLLSDQAEIDTKPELEIYADDVKCSHGATVGQLDAAAIFYLQTRGLSKDDAKHMLTRAFASEILGQLTIEECRSYLTTSLEQRLDELIDGGNQ